MKQYIDHMKYIMEFGSDRENRTGVKTRSVFGLNNRYKMADGFPAVTTKSLAFDSVKAELLCFIHGHTNVNEFQKMGTNIWNANYNADYWSGSNKNSEPGDLGRIYGAQWREFRSWHPHEGGLIVTDQLKDVLFGIKNDPTSRRLLVSAWNPGEFEFMCLPPCHVLFQFYVDGDRLSLQMYQRSADWFLGVPFNIASYSLLLHLVAHECGLIAHEFIHIIGDAHIYHDHFESVKIQLSREPYPIPKLGINTDLKSIFDFKMQDVWLNQYQKWPPIKANMSV